VAAKVAVLEESVESAIGPKNAETLIKALSIIRDMEL
jgi:hypothetical protein